MSGYPTNTDDIIDSREVIEAIDHAYAEYVEACEAEELTAHTVTMWFVHQCIDGPLGNEDPEMVALVKLAEEASDYAADWQYGVTLIRDSYFQSYAMDFADDIGAIPAEYSWPTSCIDWEQAARELHTSVDFDGVTYWVR